MIAVIFEVHLAEGKTPEYLEIASDIMPSLTKSEGFISYYPKHKHALFFRYSMLLTLRNKQPLRLLSILNS